MSFDEFVKQNLGKPVEREDPTNVDQCFDWAFAYLDDVLGVPRSSIRHLRAFQIWTEATDETRKYFDLIPNTPDGVPQKGDIPIFDKTVGVSGHVCVASGNNDGLKSFQSTDQNWNGHLYIEYIWHNYNGVLGWLRPKTVQVAEPMSKLTQKEEDDLRNRRDELFNENQDLKKSIITLNQKIEQLSNTIGQDARDDHDLQLKNLALETRIADIIKALGLPQDTPQEQVLEKIVGLQKPHEEVVKQVQPVMDQLADAAIFKRSKKARSLFEKVRDFFKNLPI